MQGMEKDVIVLTTAITRPTAFAADGQRLNVALTRARHHLLLVGCGPALQVVPFACCGCDTLYLIQHAHARVMHSKSSTSSSISWAIPI